MRKPVSAAQYLYILYVKFQDSSQLLWLHCPVCVRPGRKPPKTDFLTMWLSVSLDVFTWHKRRLDSTCGRPSVHTLTRCVSAKTRHYKNMPM